GHPWRTLQHAADVVRPGDTVRVQPGRYGAFRIERSGTAACPISFLGEPGALVSGRGRSAAIEIHASYVTLEGFRIRAGREATAVAVLNEAEGVVLRLNALQGAVSIDRRRD